MATTRMPRYVLLSPKTRRPRQCAPASMGRARPRRNPVLMHRPWQTKPSRRGAKRALASRSAFMWARNRCSVDAAAPTLRRVLRRVARSAVQVQGHVGLIAHDPAVVPGRHVEDVARTQHHLLAVVHLHGGPAGEDEPDMLDGAALRTRDGTDVFRPVPARLVFGASQLHAAQGDETEEALLEAPFFVGMIEAFDDDR